VFESTQNKIINFTNAIDTLEIRGIKFVSTKSSTTEDTEGLLFFANYGASSVQKHVTIECCEFTNPNSFSNGIKIISEGTNSVSHNFNIRFNRFYSIGRMAVETQNHVNDDKYRIRDFEVSSNWFSDIGTIQNGASSVCAISLSGKSKNCKTNYNTIREMRMDTTGFVLYGIENAGCRNMESIGNQMYSELYGFSGFLCSSPNVINWIIANNTLDLQGPIAKIDKIRAMELSDGRDIIVTGNTFKMVGYAAKLYNIEGCMFKNNISRNQKGNLMYIHGNSKYNIISENIFDNSNQVTYGETDDTIIQYNGAGATDNYQFQNLMKSYNGFNGVANSTGGATNNNLKLT